MGTTFVASRKLGRGVCHDMKLLDYSPELEDSHFAELNALDDGMEAVVDLTGGVDANDLPCAPDCLQSLAQNVQPTSSVGFPSSWQMIPDGATDSLGRNDDSDNSCDQAVVSNVDPGVSAETFDALLEQAHIFLCGLNRAHSSSQGCQTSPSHCERGECGCDRGDNKQFGCATILC